MPVTGSKLDRDAVRPLHHVGGLVRDQPRRRACSSQRGEGRRLVSPRATRVAVRRRRRPCPRPVAGRSQRPLPLGGRPGGVPGACRRMHADRRGRGAAAAPVGLLPLPGGHVPRHRRSRRGPMRHPHARRATRGRDVALSGERGRGEVRCIRGKGNRPIPTRRTPTGPGSSSPCGFLGRSIPTRERERERLCGRL